MSKEEYSALKIGDKVWLFDIEFSVHGNLYYNMIAKLEKLEGKDRFKILDVKMGSSFKPGDTQYLPEWKHSVKMFKDYNEGVDYWNSIILNKIDYMTSIYEKMIKRAKSKLLKKK